MASEPQTFEVFPFRYRDARARKWRKARYAEWGITGPGEERRPATRYFNPGRQAGKAWGIR